MTQELFKTDACTIRYDAAIDCVELEWHGYATSPQFRLIAEQLLIAMRITGTGKILDDHTHMKMLSVDDQRWTLTDWLPRAIDEGFRGCAIVRSTDYFNRVTTLSLFSQIEPGIVQPSYFDGRETAREWLRKIP